MLRETKEVAKQKSREIGCKIKTNYNSKVLCSQQMIGKKSLERPIIPD